MLHTVVKMFIAAAMLAASGLQQALPANAQAGDGCPDDTSTPQQACYLGPDSVAEGAIAFEGDQHFYRFEALDFGVGVEVDFIGAPYRVTIVDWAGDQIQSRTSPDNNGLVLTQRLGPPGSYYLLVDSPTRSYNPNHTYTIERHLTYESPPIPSVLASGDFPPTLGNESVDRGDSTFDVHGGSLHQHMADGGTQDTPSIAPLIFRSDFVTVTDFTLTLDAKLEGGTYAGYEVYFRYIDPDNYYRLIVDSSLGKVRLLKVQDGDPYRITDWVSVPRFAGPGVMNRTVIKATAANIRVNINGTDVLTAKDAGLSRGRIGFGAITWSEPADLAFNNLLVTTPSNG